MAGRWRLFALGWVLALAGGLLAHLAPTAGGVKVEDVRYRGAGGETLSALLYIPPGADPGRPAPAVLVSHAYINSPPRPGSDQVWIWEEVGTLTALVGFVAIVLGACEGLTASPPFDSLAPAGGYARPPVGGARPAPARWWFAFLLAAATPAVSFHPLMDAGFAFRPSRVFPEWVSNQLVVWALGSTALSVIAYVLTRRGRARFAGGGIKPAALAVLCVAFGYVALALVDALFNVDFRFWLVGLKPLDPRHALYALAYFPFFAVVFVLMSRSLLASLVTPAQGPGAQYLALVLAPCLGFAVLLLAQHVSLNLSGRLLSPQEALNTIIAIQFVPVLAFVGLVTVFTWRRTGGYLAGGLICALVVTWYVTAGTATHLRPGWTLPKSVGLYPARPAAAAASRP